MNEKGHTTTFEPVLNRPGSPSGRKSPSARRFLAVLLLPGLVLFVWLNYLLVTRIDYPNIDFTYFYAAGKVLVQGGNPYDLGQVESVYAEVGRTRIDPLVNAFPYPLWSDYLFAPFGLLNLEWALTAWTIFNELCLVLTFWMLVRVLLAKIEPAERLPAARFLVMAGLVLFVPGRHFVRTLLNGQTSIFTTMLLALFIYSLAFRRWRLAGLALLAGVFKPTPFVLFLPVALLWLLPKPRRAGIYAFLAGSALLALTSFIINPGWVSQWLAGRTGEGWNVVLRISTLWGGAGLLGRSTGLPELFLALAVPLGLALLAGLGFAWWKSPALKENPALAWGLLATLSIYLTIYAFSYESAVLVIPLLGLLALIRRYPAKPRNLALAGLALLLLGLPWALNPLKTPWDESLAGLFPLTTLLFSGLILLYEARTGRAAEA